MISPETRVMGLPYGEEIMIVGQTMWTQFTSVTDRRTDGRTDRITITKTVQRRPLHDKNHLRCVSVRVSFCLSVYAHGYLGPNISKTVKGRGSVTMDNQ